MLTSRKINEQPKHNSPIFMPCMAQAGIETLADAWLGCHDRGIAAEGGPMRSTLNGLLQQLVLRGWAKRDPAEAEPLSHTLRNLSDGPWWSIDLASDDNGNITTVLLHPWEEGLLEFTITVLVDEDDEIRSFELECNAMPVPVALINWWGGLDMALRQAATLRQQLINTWDREISAGGELP